ncbi:2'-5' RNA ligase family protein [Ottowia testudinis]|uniref:2'-5' RNA ligase family protein n=1 Tax=Ottowia testudinis TaxID=2816950 RepID=A0A975H1K5_9BURK|nr:2'-5' RNA ligase family protein [Ottowia testudinis]QTD43849.1 2'-5' RNA ligase family protein [Ottowia testudinis]
MTDALYVVAFPVLTASAQSALEAVRRLHDPQVDVVQPHVTLVFSQIVDVDQAAREMLRVSSGLRPCQAVFRRAMPWWTGSGPAHVFLVPDEGFSSLGSWHDALHASTSVFAPARRLDIPFVPHMTLGAAPNAAAAGAMASEWNAHQPPIEAMFDHLILGCLQQVSEPRFNTLASAPVGLHP